MHQDNRHHVVIIGETAFNHEGSLSYLFRLIEMVAQAGATHVKFQVLIDHDDFVSQTSAAYELVKSWCFTREQWEQAFEHAESLGLRLFLMPLDKQAVALCTRGTVDYVEIHSVSFNDRILLDTVRDTLTETVIGLGIGGRTLEELQALEKQFPRQKLLFLCGFQAFPSQLEEVKLARIKYLQQHFPNAVMGYADHSDPAHPDAIYSSHYAYQLGARVFEKHVTLEIERTDAQSAYMVEGFTTYIEQLHRFISIVDESAESAFEMTNNECIYRARQKKAVATQPVAKGDLFTAENLALKMHSDDGAYTTLDTLLNTSAQQDYSIGDAIC
ncbi:N-acetylneuraminate synthase family protein [Vibrio sp. D420a]|uniref:N-acetylneuraminate synthase family protein n=1 Tax=Vibrio sp. D420a TaxID=2836895 RepID=UPI0025574A8C|nr:N-acetylneuraminate synthase family protein [Vibrio sp. D420a]MDK9762812.1 N-acetylneuraminate synthase family protein [Vibrio sp. D420a]